MELSSQSYEALRRMTLVCLEGYSKAGVQKMLEAEALVSKAMELREEAAMLFNRCDVLALEFAVAKASPVPEEEIDW